MATEKRTSRSTGNPRSTTRSKKSARPASARRRTGLKAAPGRKRRATAATPSATHAARGGRKGGVIKRALKKGISELAKVGS